ncbi:hypothetical protein [Algicella marina]|uniref:Capsule polysaccharide biosynthesis protein n=1 Tax=Algicella marina TaxID=2683284 RepID=A0A6P1SZ78_9RHOB|nr:hypothetical protein [Algicella marina]QHQ34673.1 hypothetical protein GO499_05440 [Algicella marina]
MAAARKICVVSTAANTDKVLDELRATAPELDFVLHFGRKKADYMTASISRMSPIAAERGHLTVEAGAYSGAHGDAMLAADYWRDAALFEDHFMRRDPLFANNSHKLRNHHDYMDFFHILSDMIAGELARSGADTVLFFNVPHLAYDTVLYQVAQARGLQCLIVTQMLIPGYFASMHKIGDLGFGPRRDGGEPFAIARDENLQHFYMPDMTPETGSGRLNARNIASLAVYLLKKEPSALVRPGRIAELVTRMRAVKSVFPDWRDPFAKYFHVDQFAYLETLASFEKNTPDLSQRYVYFPLQLQPEMTTSALGGRFADQILAIEQLARILPEGVKIFVKENPKQGSFLRGPLHFHRLRRIPAVEIMPSHLDTHALNDNAEFVAAVTGTAGWEAIRKGKPALVFGNAWYGDLPGVVRFRGGLNYSEIVSTMIDHDELEMRVGAMLAGFHQGIVERHYVRQLDDFDPADNVRRVAATVRGLLAGEVPVSFSGP